MKNKTTLILLTLFLLPFLLLGLFNTATQTAANEPNGRLAVNDSANAHLEADGACTRFDLEEGRNATTGAGIPGRYEMREVGSGRVLAIWRAAGHEVDSGWVEGIVSSFNTSSWVEVYFYPDAQETPIRLEVLNSAPDTEYGWVKQGVCHAVEVQFPLDGAANRGSTDSNPSAPRPTNIAFGNPTIRPVATPQPATTSEDVAVAANNPPVIPTLPPPPQVDDPEAPPALPANWLVYINEFRSKAHLPTVSENHVFTQGSSWHSSYMVLNDEPIAHKEDPTNPLYNDLGNEAAIKGNIFATTQIEGRYNWAINFWLSAPFHSIPLLDPRLESVGYGDFVNDGGTFKMAAVADVRSGVGELPDSVTYPVFFPGDGSQTWVARLSMLEWPNPYGNCPGYQQPSGPALVMQLGTGDLTPNVSNAAFVNRGQNLDICVFDETTYRNTDQYAQGVGRSILNQRDAVVVIPRHPLIVGETYEVYIVANDETYSWSFEVIKPEPAP